LIGGDILEYEICYTGSSGNCNIIKTDQFTFMVDCGVPFSWIEEANILENYKVDYLIITHRHSDHLRVPTYNRLHRQYPDMEVITNSEVQEFLKTKNSHYYPDYIIESGLTFNLGDLEVNFIENLHGVSTQGFIMIEFDEVLLYATDLSTVAFYEQFLDNRNIKLDICLLENNYDMQKLIDMLEEHSSGYDKATAQSRHLDHEEYNTFIGNYSKSTTIHEELHQSSSLY
jgi:flavorubredoxin